MKSLLIVLVLLISNITAHAAVGEEEQAPCTRIEKEATVATCWACFNLLLKACEEGNPSEARRDACFKGAEKTLEWCLDRVPSAAEMDDVEGLIQLLADGHITQQQFEDIFSMMSIE